MEKKEPGFVIFVLWSFLSSGCFTGGMVHKWSCMLRPTALKYDHGSSKSCVFLVPRPNFSVGFTRMFDGFSNWMSPLATDTTSQTHRFI